MDDREPIAIIGSGCRFPGNANSPSALWELLRSPRDVLNPIPDERVGSRGFHHENAQYHGHTNVTKAYLLSGEGIHRRFDAQFFGISPAEAKVMDPQARLVMETVFEAMEMAGQSIDNLEGSNTAVYSGVMLSDYELLMSRDEASLGKYHLAGTARSFISNRVSYFFDWHGPSVTMDTACSSSLVAVHYAVQQLRSGQSKVALVTGSNLLLDPVSFIGGTKMQMLSADSRSRMWDAAANGYARGEGVAAVVLKPLRAAEADGDPIQCIIRETGVNQDGKTQGITTPNAAAQATLIRDCYDRAGLDIASPTGRPQYFEAHGTGTPTGDPVEAEAINATFFGGRARIRTGIGEPASPLFVGSIKTIIGHTEGAAGIAGLLKASLALQHATIPPNLLFDRLNPKINPFYSGLILPTSALPWPPVPTGSTRRASVNSFGFGGTNAHAILEAYIHNHGDASRDVSLRPSGGPVFCPFVFSATSSISLAGGLEAFSDFVKAKRTSLNLQDLAFTLHARRTRFPLAVAFYASTADQLVAKIDHAIDEARTDPDHLGTRAYNAPHGLKPRVLAIFTGQGAQWARMGADLISYSSYARTMLKKLEARLACLPPNDRPSWSLIEELQRDAHNSRIHLAALSQPLCTAVQILLVDLLRVAKIEVAAAVGHSSGEIAAVYAAGLISADDAICIAYYRGLYTNLALGSEAQDGTMMVVGSGLNDVQELLRNPGVQGRACVAAINSSTSITISGDSDVIDRLALVFEEEKKFARRLKVDKAYHSHHMNPCSMPFLGSLKNLDIRISSPSQCTWFSSVSKDDTTHSTISLKDSYWNQNMISPVLFMQAITRACSTKGPFDIAIEIGPHPALETPVLQTIQEVTGQTVPYTGLLKRDSSDIEALADGLGYISNHLGKNSVDFQAYDFLFADTGKIQMVRELPTYSWNHQNEYWHESRYAKAISSRADSVHELLGHLSPDSTKHEMRWRQLLMPREVPWLKGHQIQHQIIFPAAGYIVTALEAAMVVLEGASVSFIEVLDFEIGQPLLFENEDSSLEVVLSFANIRRSDSQIDASFHFNGATGNNESSLVSFASGSIRMCLGNSSSTALPPRGTRPSNLLPVKTKSFYDALANLGYHYSNHFMSLTGLERKLDAATGTISNVHGSKLLLHPAVLDGAFQAVILAASYPNDGRLLSMHLPTSIRSLRINPTLCKAALTPGERLSFDASQLDDKGGLAGDASIFSPISDNVIVQVEGLECHPLSAYTANDDRMLFSSTVWGPAFPDAKSAALDGLPTGQQYDTACLLERIACFYLRKLDQDVPLSHSSRYQGSYAPIFKLASRTRAKCIEWPFWKPEWAHDNLKTIDALCRARRDVIDIRLLHKIGQNLADIVMDHVPAIELGMADGLLSQAYREGLGMREYTTYLARVIKQIVHRYPLVNCLEIGAGTGAATEAILDEVGQSFSSYVFTDISPGFFDSAKTSLGSRADQMHFRTLDISKDPCLQGFEEYSYDLIVASLVLHATPSLMQTLENVRRLLRPGGYLVTLELHENPPAHYSTILGTFSGWWLGVEEGRVLSPCIGTAQWDDLLRKTGFSGVYDKTPDPNPFVQPMTLFVSQAMDDRLDFLRNPFAYSPSLFSRGGIVQDLLLLGGEGSKTAEITLQLEALLSKNYRRIQRAQNLLTVKRSEVSSATTLLCLLDLDSPFFKDLTNTRWELMKLVLGNVGSIVWITQGRRAENPYSNMTIGLLRSLVNELPSLDVQCLDFEDPENLTAKFLGATLLRFEAAISWKRDKSLGNLHLTIEPELVIEKGGVVVIPRVIPERAMNDRYNSSRRLFLSRVDMGNNVVDVVHTDGSYFLRQKRWLDSSSPNEFVGRVTHSLVAPIKVAGNGRLFLSFGVYSQSSTPFIALSTKNASAISPETFLALPVNSVISSAVEFLHLVSSHHVASEILWELEEGDKIWIHEPSSAFAAIVRNKTRHRGIGLTLTTSCSDDLPMCIYVHPNLPEYRLRALLPTAVNVFVDLSMTNESHLVGNRIRSQLLGHCRFETTQTLFGGRPLAPSQAHSTQVRRALQITLNEVENDVVHVMGPTPILQVTRLEDLYSANHHISPQSFIDWGLEDKPLTRVQPIDSYEIFSANKTYWLVGLTGTLGLSLCHWMVRHGARYIALSSRTPNIEPSWLNEMAALGAIIEIHACDVTVKDSLTAAYASICQNLPPITGVAQGAMILHDVLVNEMSLKQLQKVTSPKVEGSIYLNEIFHENTLEFLIFLSSISILGTPGQSAYSGANLFMASLAEQRRRRGLAASVINIGPIYGAGYLAKQQIDVSSNAAWVAAMPMSEQDFHQLFAEAAMAGYPQSGACVEINTGVRQVRLDEENLPKWSSNPLMSHFVLGGNNKIDDSKTVEKPNITLRTQLSTARSLDDVYHYVRLAFLEMLHALVQLNVEDSQPRVDAYRLNELGIDSFMATEIRAWLMEQLFVTYPFLTLLSGISVKEVITEVTGMINPALIPNVQLALPDLPKPIVHVWDSKSEPVTHFLSETTSAHDSRHSLELNSMSSDSALDDRTTKKEGPKPFLLASVDLSLAQAMFSPLSLLFEDKSGPNIAAVVQVTGAVQIQELEEVVRTLGDEYECFRTCFYFSDGKAMQGIMAESILRLEHRKIHEDTELKQTVQEVQEYIYDLERGETVRLILLSLSSARHFLIIGTTHLTLDGFSFQVLARKMFRQNSGSETQPILQYRQYMEAQNHALLSGEFDEDLRFWKAQFSSFPPTLPILRVSPIVSRPSLATFDHSIMYARIGSKTKSQIQSVSRENTTTPFHFYLACFRALLTRYSDAEDCSIGIVDANRSEVSMNSLGVFLNILPLRFFTKASYIFEHVLQETRDVAYAALDHSRVPLQALIKELHAPRLSSCTPIFQCIVNYKTGLGKEVMGDYEIDLRSIEVSKTGYDLTLDIIDDPKGDTICKLIIRKDLYRESEAKVLIGSFEMLVEAFSGNLGMALSKPQLYCRSDIQAALNFGQGLFRDSDWPETVIHRIDLVAEMCPNQIAVRSGTSEVVTYLDLVRLSASIAVALTAAGAAIGSRIALLQEPSPHWIASILAVMRIGGVYLPLDLSIPWTRLTAIVEDCNPLLMLVDVASLPHVHKLQQPHIASINVSELDSTQKVPPIVSTSKGEAMILYTSGSSGTPKGIILNHESIRRQLEPTQEIYGIGAEVVLQQSASSFDMAYAQILTALCFGGSVYPLPRELRGDAQAITNLIASKGITHTFATPTEYSSWMRYGETSLRHSAWKTALCGGEVFSEALRMQFASLRKDDLRVFNGYGPTETFVVATAIELVCQNPQTAIYPKGISVGFVVPNYSVYIVDQQLNIVPPGVQGEIYIGGASVANGYVNDFAMTAERFLPDIFASDELKTKGWIKMHRVGDLGRWREDGTLLIEGRISGDTQIKLRGIRIDLREIENAMITASSGALTEVVVSVRSSSSESPSFLVAHVSFNPSTPENSRGNLLQSLPSSLPLPKYMLPAMVISLQEMPKTTSAKLDRRAIGVLPLPHVTEHDGHNLRGEMTQTELQLRDIWIEIIQKQASSCYEILSETDFFDAGGSSLLLLDLQFRVRMSFNADLRLSQLMESSTLSAMACLIENRQSPPRDIINWDTETAVPKRTIQLLGTEQTVQTSTGIVVLTGAAGYLGRALLDALIADDLIAKVHCIGIRNINSKVELSRLKKTLVYEGDLKLPRLGLSPVEAHKIFGEADCIIHNGAQVSHMQSYHSLRSSNLFSVHELVNMSLQSGRRLPLHFVSTAQVGVYYADGTGRRVFPEVGVARYPPPLDGSEGYVSTKWAAEAFLERLDRESLQIGACGWPIFVHRPALISRALGQPGLDVLHNLRHFAARMSAVPVVPQLKEYLDAIPIVELAEVVEGIRHALHEDDPAVTGVRYRHYFGSEHVSLENLPVCPDEEDEGGKKFQQLSLKEWLRRAGELGMDKTVVQWFESVEGYRLQAFPEMMKSCSCSSSSSSFGYPRRMAGIPRGEKFGLEN